MQYKNSRFIQNSLKFPASYLHDISRVNPVLCFEVVSFQLIRHIYTLLCNCVSTDAVTECYVATSNPLAVHSQLLIYSGLVPLIAGPNPVSHMDIGLLCLLCVV